MLVHNSFNNGRSNTVLILNDRCQSLSSSLYAKDRAIHHYMIVLRRTPLFAGIVIIVIDSSLISLLSQILSRLVVNTLVTLNYTVNSEIFPKKRV